MSHRTEGSARVIKSASSVAGLMLTVIVLLTCTAYFRAKPSASTAEQTAVPTRASKPTDVAWSIANSPGIVRDDATASVVQSSAISASDGLIPEDVALSPFDVDQPAVGNLSPDLLDALQRAASHAKADGIEIRINSGWRSARYQQLLLDQAIVTYGSKQEARKWVDTPEQSSHVAGNAVDVAPTEADDWLLRFGNQYGLCQTYANEIWHFELAVASGEQCPRPKDDASNG